MKKIIHPLAGGVAILMIAIFWLSTAISELSGSEPFVVLVKTLIPWGFIILVPALAAVGGTGFALGGGRSSGLVGKKRKRMPIIAANGVLILIPSALLLAAKAKAGDFDGTFYTIQMVELAAGAVNLWLLTKNALDGRKLTARRRSSARR